MHSSYQPSVGGCFGTGGAVSVVCGANPVSPDRLGDSGCLDPQERFHTTAGEISWQTFISDNGTSRPMAGEQPVSRRKALETIGVATATLGLPTAGAATAGEASVSESETSPPEAATSLGAGQSPSEADGGAIGTELTGFYTGTVDRVVDDEHVVILVETDERVIDQHVVPAKEYPSLEERDAVYLFILFGEVIAIWEVPGG